MATRARGGGARTISKKGRTKRKRQCELGTSCPYQHEYQHQLEFAHDGDNNLNGTQSGDGQATASIRGGGGATGTARRKGKGTLAQHTSGALKGTGSRGRQVAVAADRRRAERAARDDDGGVDVDGDDPREAQRARWIMRMQEQQRQQQSVTPAGPGVQLGGSRRPEARTRGEEGNEASCQSSRGSEPLRLRDATNPVVRSEPGTRAKANKPATARNSNARIGDAALPTQSRRAAVVEIDSDTDSRDASSKSEHARSRPQKSWNCKTCTFRNSNAVGLACAVCGEERG